MTTSKAQPRYRELEFGVRSVQVRDAGEGVFYVRPEVELAPFATRMTDKLVHWAKTTPEHSFVAQRERLAACTLACRIARCRRLTRWSALITPSCAMWSRR